MPNDDPLKGLRGEAERQRKDEAELTRLCSQVKAMRLVVDAAVTYCNDDITYRTFADVVKQYREGGKGDG